MVKVILTILIAILFCSCSNNSNDTKTVVYNENKIGACCVDSNTCIVIEKQKCENVHHGYWVGYDTICSPSPCINNVGACCIEDWCYIGTEQLCDENDGKYLGDKTNCDSDPCN